MIRRLVTTSALVLGLASVAHAQNTPPPGTQGTQGSMNKAQTVPHVDMSLAAIQSGQSYTTGLFDMANAQGGWDASHASMFKQHIGDDISMAQTHLGHLATAAQSNADAKNAVNEADQHLTNAKNALQGLDVNSMQPQAVANRSKQIYSELNMAQDRLGKAAQDLGVNGKLQTP